MASSQLRRGEEQTPAMDVRVIQHFYKGARALVELVVLTSKLISDDLD